MDEFLESLPTFAQEEINDLKRCTSIKEIEPIITLQNRKHETQMGSLVNPTKHLRRKSYKFYTVSFIG